MVKSMTGFGQAQGGVSPFKWTVELRSWNHRFFECSTRLPNVLSGLDDKIRDLVHHHIRRGKISITVSLRSKESETNGLVLDETKIDSYIRAMKRIQKKYQLSGPVSVNALFGIPSLFTVDHKEYTVEHYWSGLKGVLERAIRALLQAKIKEGGMLTQDLKKRIALMERSIKHIELSAEQIPAARKKRLKERLHELTNEVPIDAIRMEQEVALLAEHNDITEELVRAKHHLDFLRKSFGSSEEIGKKLDFIAQEIHREVNTIGSKAQDFGITEEVIRIKSELEKIREQVQNIE